MLATDSLGAWIREEKEIAKLPARGHRAHGERVRTVGGEKDD